MTKKNAFNDRYNGGKPMPMIVMHGEVLKTTDKCYYVRVSGRPEKSTTCLHCGRPLTNSISQHYGVGPVCGKHFYISNITEDNVKEKFTEIRDKLAEVVWEGYIPIREVSIKLEEWYEVEFMHDNVRYKTVTMDKVKVNEIYSKADKIIRNDLVAR